MVNKYQKHKERLWKEARERYQTLSEEEKDKKQKKQPWERYQNSTKAEKEKQHHYYQECTQKLPEYRRNYYSTHKKWLFGHFIYFWGPRTIKFILGVVGVIYFFLLCPTEETFEFFS